MYNLPGKSLRMLPIVPLYLLPLARFLIVTSANAQRKSSSGTVMLQIHIPT